MSYFMTPKVKFLYNLKVSDPGILLLEKPLKLEGRLVRVEKDCFYINILGKKWLEMTQQWGNDNLTILVVEIREKTCDSFEGDVAGNLKLVKVFSMLIKF